MRSSTTWLGGFLAGLSVSVLAITAWWATESPRSRLDPSAQPTDASPAASELESTSPSEPADEIAPPPPELAEASSELSESTTTVQAHALDFERYVDEVLRLADLSAQEKYERIAEYLGALPRSPLRPDDPLSEAIPPAAWKLEGMALSEPELYALARSDLVGASSENVRELAWHILLDGATRGRIHDLGPDLLAAYLESADRRNHLHLLWNAGAARDSSSALDMVDTELYFSTWSSDGDQYVYPGIERALKGYNSILQSEATSRRTMLAKADKPDHYIHQYFDSAEDVPESTSRISGNLLQVGQDPRITVAEFGAIAHFLDAHDRSALEALFSAPVTYRHASAIDEFIRGFRSRER